MRTLTTLLATTLTAASLLGVTGCDPAAQEQPCMEGVWDDSAPLWLAQGGTHEVRVGQQQGGGCRWDSGFVREMRMVGGNGAVEFERTEDAWAFKGVRAGVVEVEMRPLIGQPLIIDVEVFSDYEVTYEWGDDPTPEDSLRNTTFALFAGQPAFVDIANADPSNPVNTAHGLPEYEGAPWTIKRHFYRDDDWYAPELHTLLVDDTTGNYTVTVPDRPDETLDVEVVDASAIARVELCSSSREECIPSGESIPRGWYFDFSARSLEATVVLYTADGRIIYGDPPRMTVTGPSGWTQERQESTRSVRALRFLAPNGSDDGGLRVAVGGRSHTFATRTW